MSAINANLTAGLDLTGARRLPENQGVAFLGSQKAGPFDLLPDEAASMLAAPNPDGRRNVDVVKRRANGTSILNERAYPWIIDFGPTIVREEAALYQAPFEAVNERVRPTRATNPRKRYREEWWIHAEPRPGMRVALAGLSRYIVTPTLAKHRVFVWLSPEVLPDSQLVVFARDDDYTLGVLHSRVHELWARGQGTQLREVESGFHYTPTTTFETFPFPHPTDEQRDAIAAAAKRLDELRRGWLDPVGASDEELKVRTLTNLYNEMPTWLRDIHDRLDRAVLAAYDWPADIPDDGLLARLLALNLERAEAGRPEGRSRP